MSKEEIVTNRINSENIVAIHLNILPLNVVLTAGKNHPNNSKIDNAINPTEASVLSFEFDEFKNSKVSIISPTKQTKSERVFKNELLIFLKGE